jgi:hypothetical protein
MNPPEEAAIPGALRVRFAHQRGAIMAAGEIRIGKWHRAMLPPGSTG